MSLRDDYPRLSFNVDTHLVATWEPPIVDEVRKALREIFRLREAVADLREYADHMAGCNKPYGENYRCKCGYDRLIAELDDES